MWVSRALDHDSRTAAVGVQQPIVGGSAGAYRYFMNEGQDLGQRYREFKSLYDTVLKPSGKPIYTASYWAFIEEQAKAARVEYSRFCPTLDDKNTAAIFDGYYLVSTSRLVPIPHEHWDPPSSSADWSVRLGSESRGLSRALGGAHARAYSLRGNVIDAIYKDPQPNWNLLADKLSRSFRALPWSPATSILLGNVCLKANRAADAIKAYDHAWHEMHAGGFAAARGRTPVGALRAGESLDAIPPLRSVLLNRPLALRTRRPSLTKGRGALFRWLFRAALLKLANMKISPPVAVLLAFMCVPGGAAFPGLLAAARPASLFEGKGLAEAVAKVTRKLRTPVRVLKIEIEPATVTMQVQDPAAPTHIDEYRYTRMSGVLSLDHVRRHLRAGASSTQPHQSAPGGEPLRSGRREYLPRCRRRSPPRKARAGRGGRDHIHHHPAPAVAEPKRSG